MRELILLFYGESRPQSSSSIISSIILITIKIKNYYNSQCFEIFTIIINMDKDKNQTTWVLIKSGLAGAATGMVSLPFQHPFDALKTNMQSKQTTMLETVSIMLKSKGWRAFYNGFSMNLLRVMIKQAYRWPLWITCSAFYKSSFPNTNQALRQTLTGFTISLCQLIFITPLQRIKVWLMTTKTQQQTKIRKYYHENFTFMDLYRGFVSTLIRQGLSWSSFLASSQICKNMIKQYKGIQQLSNMDLFLASIPVSIVNTTFIMPMDCIKTLYQQFDVGTKNQSILNSILKITKQNGLRGLYFGWMPRIVQYQIQSAFTLIIIEQFHRQHKKYRGL